MGSIVEVTVNVVSRRPKLTAAQQRVWDTDQKVSIRYEEPGLISACVPVGVEREVLTLWFEAGGRMKFAVCDDPFIRTVHEGVVANPQVCEGCHDRRHIFLKKRLR
jgi:hypothetical protein